jgi:hypothetical protein
VNASSETVDRRAVWWLWPPADHSKAAH